MDTVKVTRVIFQENEYIFSSHVQRDVQNNAHHQDNM